MKRTHADRANRGFTIRDLAVVLACVLVAAGLVASLSGANRSLSQASVCTANLETLFGGLTVYVNAYNSYPPHNPYPRWVGGSAYADCSGIDPNIGWIMTYGLAMTPPETYVNDPDPHKKGSTHFKWYVLDENELPSICMCPAANHDLLFTLNPEIDLVNPSETLIYRYAACYQTSGTCRSATALRQASYPDSQSQGGRNPPIPDPSGSSLSMPADNATGGVPGIWVCSKTGDATNSSQSGGETRCHVQAVHPAEVEEPGRVYYLADSREYRPTKGYWASAAVSAGWLAGYGNKIFLGTRHYGFANVMYLDGQVNRDNQAHPIEAWNMDYNGTPGSGTSSQWRCATFADAISLAQIHTQHHIMPVLMVTGWEHFFNADGIGAR